MANMPECGTHSLENSFMRLLFILLLSTSFSFGGPKEDLLKLRNETHLLLTKERIKLIHKDIDLTVLHDNIIRTHGKLAAMLEKHPERLVEKAVKGMLPKNKLGNKLYKNLYVYVGSEHKQEAQKPTKVNLKEIK